MSDVKQAILDELEAMAQDDKGWNDKDERIRGAATARCHELVSKHLEGMAIVPEEPTEEMLEAGHKGLIFEGGAEPAWRFMINEFKAQS